MHKGYAGLFCLVAIGLGVFCIQPDALAAGELHHTADEVGRQMGLLWVVPFAGILFSIAIMPLAVPHFWHHNYGKVAVFWSAAFLVPFALEYGFSLAVYSVVHVFILEYISFIVLLFSLFTIAGGVCLRGSLAGTPRVNTFILLVGTMLASWMGTTGAAMLLIRPLMRAISHRRYRVHTIVFFIFLVANIGGSLTPLGDPPLFLGFLKGVSFFWTTVHMFIPFAVLSAILLTLYFAIDTYLFCKEGRPGPPDAGRDGSLRLEGTPNLLLLVGVVGGVLMSGMWKPGIEAVVFEVQVELQNLVRDALLIVFAGISLKITAPEIRRRNEFDWEPIREVAKLFAGIFIAMIPAISILRAGIDGALGGLISMVRTSEGLANHVAYFWLTGVLSAFLDNAPTYVVFFNTAGGDAHVLMQEVGTLLAISAGAVFFGACTYIGNAPNFMVRAIAETGGIKMPSFFVYMVWSAGILLPCYALLSFLSLC